jgi:hypothetical protein
MTSFARGKMTPTHPAYSGIAPVLLGSLTIQTNRRVLPATTLERQELPHTRHSRALTTTASMPSSG